MQNSLRPVFTLVLLVCYSQLIRYDLPVIAQKYLQHLSLGSFGIIAPALGVMGSFISGSATMSNLIFADTIRAAAHTTLHLPLFLALLHTGSAIGNAVSLQNILMVKSVLGESKINYAQVIRLNTIVIACYLILIWFAVLVLI